VRVLHYLNQFFGGIGGEDRAGHPFEVRNDAVGPGRLLQQGWDASLTTIVCGDNYFHENRDAVIRQLTDCFERVRPDVVIAGPAFGAGRYGAACGAVCELAGQAGIPALTGLHPENPAVEMYRRSVYIVPVDASARGMAGAIDRMKRLSERLVSRTASGTPEEEGYLARGIRRNVRSSTSGAERAVAMLLAKLRGEAFQTEVPLQQPRRHSPAAPLRDPASARIALISTAGVVPLGNPDGLKHINETRWAAYSIEDLPDMSPDRWEPIHGGYDASFAKLNPNVVVPLDAVRLLEERGDIGGVHARFYSAVGVGTSVTIAERLGQEMADALERDRVDGAILTAT
jgi:glycine reductase complex component B subunit gamma